MMWSILRIYIAIGLLTSYVHGVERFIKDVIKRRELIDGIFRPINGSKISEGMSGMVFKGVNMIDNSDVAMKLCYIKPEAEREYEIYSYLNAIDNPTVEKYGISPIYYYNQVCSGLTITVFPLFESDLFVKKFESEIPFKTIDYLILFRDFVRQSKYIHSRGIRHNDLKPNNIMLRKSRSFLIDFGLSSKMNEITKGYTVEFASRKLHQQLADTESSQPRQLRYQLDDWESFLYTMAYVYDVKLEWFDQRKYRGYYPADMLSEIVGKQKNRTTKTISQIEQDVKCEHLKEVMVKFANEAFKEDGSLPRYYDFEKLITKKIRDVIENNQPAVFSWLKGHERDEAIADLKNNPPATVKEIPEPKATYLATDYKEPKYDHFEKCRIAMAARAKGNHERYLMEEDERDLQKETERMKLEAENKQMKKEQSSGGKNIFSKVFSRKHH